MSVVSARIVRMEKLTAREESILRFEQRHGHRTTGEKVTAIRGTFGWPLARYYQKLNELTDSPAALAAFPDLVHRLQRLRGERFERRRSLALTLFDN